MGSAHEDRRGGANPFFDTEKTIYVGNLRFETREDTIRHFFESYGSVQAIKARGVARPCKPACATDAGAR